MKKTGTHRLRTIFIVVLIGAVVNCQQPTVYYAAVAENPTEVESMNDFTVNAVDEYPAYYVAGNGSVFGIPRGIKVAADMDPVYVVATVDGVDIEKTPDEFFILDGAIHFEVTHFFPPVDPENPEDKGENVTKWCKQFNGVVEYLDEVGLNDVPDAVHGSFNDGVASLSVGDYEGQPISIARREGDSAGYEERFILADGMTRIDGGYMVHVIAGRGNERRPGLLYWPDGVQRMDHMGKDAGRFWMM